MDTRDTFALVCAYVRDGAESAFAEIVHRYINLVYSVALRRVNGDIHLAREVSQLVFIDLARKANSLRSGIVLGGWLHQHTCYRAATAIRGERRRKVREQHAATMNAIELEDRRSWERLAPLLDDALEQLTSRERDAIILRFFEGRKLIDVGREIGLSDDAAQKLIGRALDKLRRSFSQRGIITTSASLGSTLSSHGIHAAPTGFATSTASASLAAASGLRNVTLTASCLRLCTSFIAGVALIGTLIISSRSANHLMNLPQLQAAPANFVSPMPTAIADSISSAETQYSGRNQNKESSAFPTRKEGSSLQMKHPLLQQMADAYARCQTYRDEGTIIKTYTNGPAVAPIVTPFEILFVRPGRFRAESKDSNGKKLIVWRNDSDVRAWFSPVVPQIRSGITMDVALMHYTAGMSYQLVHIPALLCPEWSTMNVHLTDFVVTQPIVEEQIEGADCYRLSGQQTFGQSLTLWIEKRTMLLRRTLTDKTDRGIPIRTVTSFRPIPDSDLQDVELDFM